jgi:hypothetical protein
VKVFLSSTWEDLEVHRAKVREALDMLRLKGLRVEWVGMEAFAASLRARSLDVAMNELMACDVYVGVLGPRYGSIPTGYDASYVELEYQVAVRLDMDRVLFLMNEGCSEWRSVGTEPSLDKRDKLTALRGRFKEDRLLSNFDSPGDLAMKVVIALLPKLISERDMALAQPLGLLSRHDATARPWSIVLLAEASSIVADGTEKSTVTARITDTAGNKVADDEPILWTVIGSGTVNPVHGYTRDGISTTVATPLVNQNGRLLVTCVAIRLGVASTIAVDLVAAGPPNR